MVFSVTDFKLLATYFKLLARWSLVEELWAEDDGFDQAVELAAAGMQVGAHIGQQGLV